MNKLLKFPKLEISNKFIIIELVDKHMEFKKFITKFLS